MEETYCPICFALVPESPGMQCPTPGCPHHGASVVAGMDPYDRADAIRFHSRHPEHLAKLAAELPADAPGNVEAEFWEADEPEDDGEYDDAGGSWEDQ